MQESTHIMPHKAFTELRVTAYCCENICNAGGPHCSGTNVWNKITYPFQNWITYLSLNLNGFLTVILRKMRIVRKFPGIYCIYGEVLLLAEFA